MKIILSGQGALGVKHLEAIQKIDGIERQDREFFAAVRKDREPNASVAPRLPGLQTLDSIEQSLL
ncbi:hypothetical protein [Phenylobacterium sp.]|jgi:hypothetical protein|uniref:hypothetical protein n=1 Tax=Phenylobacterium sp. TaxID=1871053 RepID=UPI002E321D62|nr:hypothetical protein [Phenylobacterium sp.]HEX3366007.1 hypothetical protein [Phenylobacterium sp.]